MRRIIILALVLTLSACAEEQLPPGQMFGDSGAPDAQLENDAGTDAGELDAGLEVDAQLAPDAGRAEDAGSRPDAGPPSGDAGSPVADAGPPPAPDGGAASDAGCLPDVFEANDAPASAAAVASGTGWPASTYAMTWHPGDDADWLLGDLDSTGPLGRFRVSASEATSSAVAPEIEIRVTCPGGLYTCTGPGSTPVGNTCVTSRRGNAYADVSCEFGSSRAVEVRVGIRRNSEATGCSHTASVSLSVLP